ncbi:MAG TPA: hypothetical protein VL907_06280 [Pyrinomonadaceae bacterium]|jgi:hypothetical protein|nr:hypothetical protein [Pyrinomonadaceae bacterium]
MMWAAWIVAFIAGYAVVSFLARKIKEGRDRYPDPPKNDESDSKSSFR